MNNLLSQIENNFGKYEKMVEQHLTVAKQDWFQLTGISYLPVGKIIEISGQSSSGKTSFVMDLLSHTDTANPILYIDADFSFDKVYCGAFNLTQKTFTAQTNDLDLILQIIAEYLDKYPKTIVVIDSLASLKYSGMVHLERVMSEIIKEIRETESSLIVLNQLRTNVQTHKTASFGSTRLKQYCILRIETLNTHVIKDERYLKIRTIKNTYEPVKTIENYKLIY